MSRRSIASVFIAGLLLAGCANMSDTEQRTLSGGAIGAAGGAAVGAIAGNAGMGAAIGAGAGLVGGYVWDKHKKSKEDAYERGVKDGQSSESQ
jgi:hypothetical protein